MFFPLKIYLKFQRHIDLTEASAHSNDPASLLVKLQTRSSEELYARCCGPIPFVVSALCFT